MKSLIGHSLVLVLLALLIGTVATVSAADPIVTISSNESFEFNGVEITEVSFLDLIDPAVTWTNLESTAGCDQKIIAYPEIRYVYRHCPNVTLEVDGYTITSRNVPQVDWTGMNTYPVYKKSVIPTISTAIPGETGNVVLVRAPSGPPDTENYSYDNLFAATDTMYLYTDEGIVYVNPQTGKYVLWGNFNGNGYDPNDFGKTLTNTQVDLSAFTVDKALAEGMVDAHSDTQPPPGEYLCYIFRYEPDQSAMRILGIAPVYIMDKDRALTWNGGETPTTYVADGNDVTLGFEDGEGLDGTAYFIFRKGAVFDADSMFNGKNILELKDRPISATMCFLEFLMQKTPGYTEDYSLVDYKLIADGETENSVDEIAAIPISMGYGISGVGDGSEVTVPASALSDLEDGTYLVTLCGSSEDGSIIAVDQKEFTIGSSAQNGQSRSYSSESNDGDDWLTSSEEKGAGSNEGAAEIETFAPKGGDDGTKTPGGAAAVKDVRIGEEFTGSDVPSGPSDGNAGNVPSVLGYAVLGLIGLAGVGIVLGRGRFR